MPSRKTSIEITRFRLQKWKTTPRTISSLINFLFYSKYITVCACLTISWGQSKACQVYLWSFCMNQIKWRSDRKMEGERSCHRPDLNPDPCKQNSFLWCAALFQNCKTCSQTLMKFRILERACNLSTKDPKVRRSLILSKQHSLKAAVMEEQVRWKHVRGSQAVTLVSPHPKVPLSS